MSMLYPKITHMFHFAGDKHSTPNCPVELRPDLNPSSGIQSYGITDPLCLKPAHYNIPFFLERLGPKSSEWSINSHEARPGHHIQVNSWNKNGVSAFQGYCQKKIGWGCAACFPKPLPRLWANSTMFLFIHLWPDRKFDTLFKFDTLL